MDINIEQCKENAAMNAVSHEILPLLYEFNEQGKQLIVGIGSGSTIVHVINALLSIYNDDECNYDFATVSTSNDTMQMLLDKGLPMLPMEYINTIDIVIDGVDEIDPIGTAIKGGGGCHVQEKIVSLAGDRYVAIADYRKLVPKLEREIPVAVLPKAYTIVKRYLSHRGYNLVLRKAGNGKCGSMISDEGFLLGDLYYDVNNEQLSYEQLKSIPGIVDIGIFPNIINKSYIGEKDGSVTVTIYPTFI